MTYNLLLVSGDAKLTEQLQSALGSDCALLVADPRMEEGQSLARRFDPHGLIVDAGTHTGSKTVLETIAALRRQFLGLPMIVIGDELSAQLILASFRAGADDFLDRESSDMELRTSILSRLRDNTEKSGHRDRSVVIDILSAAPSDEDYDFALNTATLLAAGDREKRILFLDFSLPASPAHLALGLDINFTVPAAIRDIVRLDRTFLDSALARVNETGLYVLPLSDTAIGMDGLPALRDVFILLQMLRSLFDIVVIYWGAFSRQAAQGGLSGEGRYPFICCNQRFSSVRNAKGLYAEVLDGSAPLIEPVVVIHQLGPNIAPATENIVRAIGAKRGFGLRATWGALVQAQNSGRPLTLMGPSQYGSTLRAHLAMEGFLPPQRAARERMPNLLEWLRKARVQ